MTTPGYGGNILHVDSTREEIRKESLGRELAKEFSGGWGINNRPAIEKLSHSQP